MASRAGARIDGLDLARFLALIGMFCTHLWLWGPDGETPLLSAALGGKASALFAVLAGVGMALTTRRDLERGAARAARLSLLGRGAALILIGLALGLFSFFVLVILVYYGVMFWLVIPFVRMRPRWLLLIAAACAIVWPVCSHVLRALLGTDARSPSSPNFVDLFQPHLFVVDVLLSGAYPSIAWTVYGLAGMAIGKLIIDRIRRVSTARALNSRGAGRTTGTGGGELPVGDSNADAGSVSPFPADGGLVGSADASSVGSADASSVDAVPADRLPVDATTSLAQSDSRPVSRPQRRSLAALGAWLAVSGTAVAVAALLVSDLLVRFVYLPRLLAGTAEPGPWVGAGTYTDAQLQQLTIEALREDHHGTTTTETPWNLLSSGPHTGTTFDLLITAGCAAAVIGVCLVIGAFLNDAARRILMPVLGAGGAPLTVYSVHVILATLGWAILLEVGADRMTTWWVSSWQLWLAHVALALAIGLALRLVGKRGPLERFVTASGRAVASLAGPSGPSGP